MNGQALNSAGSVAARLVERYGGGALTEARYQLSLAEDRFRVALLRAGKELDTIEHWAAVNNLLAEQAPEAERPAPGSPPPDAGDA